MNKINRIAKKIFARTQMVKDCIVNQHTLEGQIIQSIFLQEQNYNFFNFKEDLQGFKYDIDRQLKNLKLRECDINDIKLKINDNKLLDFKYTFFIPLTDEYKQLFKINQWNIKQD